MLRKKPKGFEDLQEFQAYVQKEKQSGLEKLQKDSRSSCLPCNTMTEHLILMTTLAQKIGTHTQGGK